MIQISVDTRRAVVTNKEMLTAGSAGIQVQFTLSEDWDALSKLAVFRAGDDGTKVDVVLGESLTCVVPPEVLTQEDEVLFIGIYGANGQGTVIIPTVWASAGVVKPGTVPNTPVDAQPTPEIWAQILDIAQDAEQTAGDAMTYVEESVQQMDETCAQYVTDAQGYANAAAASATDANTSAFNAEAHAQRSDLNANNAATSAGQASINAGTASTAAEIATTQAGIATTKAEEAALSATAAGNAQTAAEAAQEAAEAAQEAVEDSAAQIAQNTQDITELKTGKQDAPAESGDVGMVLALDDNLDPIWRDPGVYDVKWYSSSLVSNGVARIPAFDSRINGNNKVSGLAAFDNANAHGFEGFASGNWYCLTMHSADTSGVKAGTAKGQNGYGVVDTTNYKDATFYGLAKAAGDTTQAASSNPVGTYTDGAKAAIKDMIGATAGDIEFDDQETYAAGSVGAELSAQSNAIDAKQDATNYVTLSGTIVTQTGADNTMYLCGELAELTFTAPATGITAIRFTSGTTPTVATFSGVTWLNGFDPSAIEASKTYEVNILNGLGCAAWT